MASNKTLIFPDWVKISRESEALDGSIANIMITPQQRAAAWKKLKLPIYAVHDYIKQIPKIMKVCYNIVGHHKRGELNCKFCKDVKANSIRLKDCPHSSS